MSVPPHRSDFHPAATYVEAILAPNFSFARRTYGEALIAILAAHTLMLEQVGLLTAEEAEHCLQVLAQVDRERLAQAEYDQRLEDFFFFLQQELERLGDVETVGKMFLARSRNDLDVTLYRMVLRERLLGLALAMHRGGQILLELADRHRETLTPAYTHTQPAQPTTVGHYLVAAASIVGRDLQRLQQAFAELNRSPLGACALATTSLPIDRTLTATWLGFEGLVENSYDAIAAADYLTAVAAMLAVAMTNLGRLAQDLLLWCSEEHGGLRLADGFVQISSLMPQKRNPVALEHVRALASRALGQAQAVFALVHNTPFSDVNDFGDDVQPVLHAALDDAQRAWLLFAAVLESAEIRVDRLGELAHRGLMTVTDLADLLCLREGIAFPLAHRLVAEAIAATGKDPTADRLVAELVRRFEQQLGRRPQSPPTEWLAALDPRHFVQVRRVRGGPAPEEVARQSAALRQQLQQHQAWLDQKRALLDSSLARLWQTVRARVGSHAG